MEIYGVSFDLVGKQPIVLLKTAEGNRYLPIWIGHPEAAAILMKLQGATAPRPLTHDLLVNMLGELEVEVVRVTVTELRENTFHASITVAQNGTEVEIDSRSSDAIAVAVRARSPIICSSRDGSTNPIPCSSLWRFSRATSSSRRLTAAKISRSTAVISSRS